MPKKFTIIFHPQNIKCTITSGQTILDASYKADISINAGCSGLGTCGLCKVKILKGQFETKESHFISFEEKKGNIVLACMTTAKSNLDVEVYTYEKEKSKITSFFEKTENSKEISPVFAVNIKENYGIAVDIGTTTISLDLINLENGIIIDEESDYNGQIKYGHDIIHRIIVGEKKTGLLQLKNSVRTTINQLVNKILRRNNLKEDIITCYSISGNTTMTYLFLGFDPSKIRIVPPQPLELTFPLYDIGSLGFYGMKEGRIFICPGVSNYIGGDIVSGAAAIGINSTENLILFLDIGTNGEIVLGNKDWLISCACSAGPSFEGMGIDCGMRAAAGAIENISVNPDLSNNYSVIGGIPPKGLCGTAMIDLMADLFNHKIINGKGKYIVKDHSKIKEINGDLSYVIHENIYLSEKDLDNLIRTKAAIYSGISSLIKKVGIDIKDISNVIIGGGFGHYLNIDKCLDIGMFPKIPKEKFLFYGNTSLSGARLMLLSSQKRKEAEEIAKKITYIDLSTENLFMDEFTAALFIPHTN